MALSKVHREEGRALSSVTMADDDPDQPNAVAEQVIRFDDRARGAQRRAGFCERTVAPCALPPPTPTAFRRLTLCARAPPDAFSSTTRATSSMTRCDDGWAPTHRFHIQAERASC